MDKDGYPEDSELKIIREWDASDFHGLMAYIYDRWNYADCGYWDQKKSVYRISTGGWSGNEEIIGAMMENHIWWMMYWQQSQRGGHYIFSHPNGLRA
jgi:hypothetical protein